MIKYRPNRHLLTDAMKEYKEFNTMEEMCDYIIKNWEDDWKNTNVNDRHSIVGVFVDPKDYGEDERIGWKHWRYILMIYREGEKCTCYPCGYCDLGVEI